MNLPSSLQNHQGLTYHHHHLVPQTNPPPPRPQTECPSLGLFPHTGDSQALCLCSLEGEPLSVDP